eukprot:227790_1
MKQVVSSDPSSKIPTILTAAICAPCVPCGGAKGRNQDSPQGNYREGYNNGSRQPHGRDPNAGDPRGNPRGNSSGYNPQNNNQPPPEAPGIMSSPWLIPTLLGIICMVVAVMVVWSFVAPSLYPKSTWSKFFAGAGATAGIHFMSDCMYNWGFFGGTGFFGSSSSWSHKTAAAQSLTAAGRGAGLIDDDAEQAGGAIARSQYSRGFLYDCPWDQMAMPKWCYPAYWLINDNWYMRWAEPVIKRYAATNGAYDE